VPGTVGGGQGREVRRRDVWGPVAKGVLGSRSWLEEKWCGLRLGADGVGAGVQAVPWLLWALPV